MSVDGVLGCHQIRTRGSADHVFLDLHVWLPADMPLTDAHDLSHVVKDRLMARYPQIADAVIHIEPPPRPIGDALIGARITCGNPTTIRFPSCGDACCSSLSVYWRRFRLFAQNGAIRSIRGPAAAARAGRHRARSRRGASTVRATRVPSPFVFDGRLEEAFYHDVRVVRRLHPAGAARRTAGHRQDRGLGVLRQRQPVCVVRGSGSRSRGKRVATEMRRDANNLYNNDHFGVSFDGFYDRRNGYGFAVNALGGMLDWSINNEQPNNNWNGVWDVTHRPTSSTGGRSRSAFRSARSASSENGHVWGMNFRRHGALQERSGVPGARAGLVGPPGHVEDVGGGDGDRPRRACQGQEHRLKPYALGSVVTDRKAATPVCQRSATATWDST